MHRIITKTITSQKKKNVIKLHQEILCLSRRSLAFMSAEAEISVSLVVYIEFFVGKFD